ncbi:hypothetical protein H0H87_002110 [Tephrocybe sp. NHM501043]|nr:hypothetical protein H0H87_002110 [Tephrocybe sp. NHM501043]
MAVLNQRRIEATSSDEAHPLRGIGWITGGLKLGAIETVIGFAANGFGSAMTRRIMRMLARASLIIGLLRGLDSSEDFSHLEEELAGAMRFRRSRLRQFISNPRYSTFRQLTPTTTAFHSTPHAPHGLASSPPGRPLSGISATEKFSGVDGTLSTDKNSMVKWPAARRERVTVRFEGGAPSLHMRFSALEISDLPISLFDLPVNLIKDSQPPTLQSAIVPLHVQSSQSLLPSNVMDIHEPLTKQSENLPMINHITALQSPSTVYYPPTKMKRMQSAHSVWNTMDSYTSLSTVRDVASQFPPLPDRVLKPMGCSPPDKRAPDFWDNTTSVLSQTSIIKPRHLGLDLTGTANTSNLEALEATIVNVGERSMDPNTQTNPLKSAITTPATALSNYMPVPATPVAQSVMTAQTEDPYMDFGPALNSGKSRAFVRESSGLSPAADWIDYNAIPGPPLPLVTEESERLARIGHRRSRKSGSMGTLRISWIKNPDMEEAQLTRAVSLKSHIARIKSVGKAPIRSTPRPTRTTHTRGSLHIEHIQIPKKEFSNVEIIQGSFESAYDCSILRDSDVLGNEDFTNKLQV